MFDDILGQPINKTKTITKTKRTKKPRLIKLMGKDIKALLKENDPTEYYVKLTRLYYPNQLKVWNGKTRLHVQRENKKPRNIGVLTPVPADIPISWAEYCSQDIEDNGSCVTEDYLMEIWKEI